MIKRSLFSFFCRFHWKFLKWGIICELTFSQHKIFLNSKLSNIRLARKNLKLLSASFCARLLAVREVLVGNYFFKCDYLDLLDSDSLFKIAMNLKSNRFKVNNFNIFIFKIKGLSLYFSFPYVYNTCLECLWNISLLPFVDARSDRFSYGHRPFRFCYDFYLYKSLWKFVKKFHPRRSNKWIYLKYWKNFGGLWKFLSIYNGKVYILKAHSCFVGQIKTYRFPASLSIFNSKHYRKRLFLLLKKTCVDFKSTFGVLYNRQKGVCYVCHCPIAFNSFRVVRNLLNPSRNSYFFLSDLYLIHIYCNYPFKV
uniref:RoaA n=1 Tax=Euglena clara TaxID=215708 RepID=A0A2Z4YZ03_9EUGL|nr:roaA [Euglena clara]AXA45463.1 roaA [Euglena clara]